MCGFAILSPMKSFTLTPFGFDLRILAALAALAAILGVLNNLRVHEEKHVAWFGDDTSEKAEERP